MKLNDLKAILYSSRDNLQFAILYDIKTNEDIAKGSIDYIIANYGNLEVVRIEAIKNNLVITV